MAEQDVQDAEAIFPPRGSCDCHVHVIGPKSRFPLAAGRRYTPADATTDDLKAMMARVGVDRAVIVHPSIFGTDNSCTLDALATMGNGARGVAVLPADAGNDTLDVMHALGVRGVRLNVVSGGAAPADSLEAQIKRAARQCAPRGWHLQLFAEAALLEALAPMLAKLPVPVVFDHFAMVRPGQAESESAQTISRLIADGRAWVKLSGFYRVTDDPFDPAIGPVARHFYSGNPERVVWASDWPHTPHHADTPEAAGRETPYRPIDTKALLYGMRDWFAPDELQRILVDNPAQLYDFA
jgi:predicted TIM-barrel fold metal-dependent hydrolase